MFLKDPTVCLDVCMCLFLCCSPFVIVTSWNVILSRLCDVYAKGLELFSVLLCKDNSVCVLDSRVRHTCA